VQLVYNSADFKGMATGRNVSQVAEELANNYLKIKIRSYQSSQEFKKFLDFK
jgi:hypothetical protein